MNNSRVQRYQSEMTKKDCNDLFNLLSRSGEAVFWDQGTSAGTPATTLGFGLLADLTI